MIFYEDFVKKIEELEGEDLSFSEIESFGLGKKKKIGGYGIALPLILIACYEIFVAFFLKTCPWVIKIVELVDIHDHP